MRLSISCLLLQNLARGAPTPCTSGLYEQNPVALLISALAPPWGWRGEAHGAAQCEALSAGAHIELLVLKQETGKSERL